MEVKGKGIRIGSGKGRERDSLLSSCTAQISSILPVSLRLFSYSQIVGRGDKKSSSIPSFDHPFSPSDESHSRPSSSTLRSYSSTIGCLQSTQPSEVQIYPIQMQRCISEQSFTVSNSKQLFQIRSQAHSPSGASILLRT